MGGYQLAESLVVTKESWIMATTVGYMVGATIVFSIPVALKTVKEKYHRQMSLGIMIGFITIPVGVLVSNIIIALMSPSVRALSSTSVCGSNSYPEHDLPNNFS
ncbi:ethanolamine utilization protein EutH [Erysipelothrix sp. D19-032]